ncbi:hypothetical protein [Clostridium felsineum]|uniref:Uncharacterized protein n=1 Tax=Clostridium felsineum TaxID=36839 RepID=A0A1S8L082_9CLOT|nr:hypothetical protein [Clostridium felsineum]URZ06430.1 hypothetical protein CLROS_017630 [Clostridium felsineum]URZ11465.1 hypothetical protein CROST_021820 [Clostridium felsineum]
MAAYMITYDLDSPGQKYEDVIKAIKDSSSSWCTYWKSSYLIKSNLTATQISNNINSYLDDNDTMIVTEVLTTNYQGWLNKDQWKFIKENIFN